MSKLSPSAKTSYTGDVVFYRVFGTKIIMLNTIEVAAELLDKRSANYSDRPRMVMQNEMQVNPQPARENCID